MENETTIPKYYYRTDLTNVRNLLLEMQAKEQRSLAQLIQIAVRERYDRLYPTAARAPRSATKRKVSA